MSLKSAWTSLVRRWRRCLAVCSISAMLIGGSVLMVAGATVRFVSGSPYARGMMMQFGSVIPPPPLMSLCWMIWYGVLGATFGCVLCGRRCDLHTQAVRYRGGMLFLCMIFLGFLWYPLFFIAGHVLLATLIHFAVLALCILTALCYVRLFRAAAVVLFCHAAYLAWLAVVSVRVLLH